MTHLQSVMRGLGVVVAFGFMGFSALINWRYGVTLARGAEDQLIFSIASLLADTAKAVTPFLFFFAFRSRRWAQATAAALFWFGCTAYSLASLAGFSEQMRAAQAGALTAQKLEHQTLSD